MSRRHNLTHTHRTPEHSLPRAVGYGKRRTRKENGCRRTVPGEQLCELAVGVATKPFQFEGRKRMA